MSSRFLVVGASSGIGRALVIHFLELGAQVIAVARDSQKLLNLKETVARPEMLTTITLNMAHPSSSTELAAQIPSPLNGVIVTAGSGAGSHQQESILKFEESVNMNIRPILNTWDAALPFISKDGGAFIAVSSIAANEYVSAPFEYAMAKATLRPFVKHMSRSHPEIRVNLVSPGNVATEDSVWQRKMKNDPKDLARYLLENCPQNRLAKVKEVVDVIAFLASEQASFVTGADWVVDGGQTKAF